MLAHHHHLFLRRFSFPASERPLGRTISVGSPQISNASRIKGGHSRVLHVYKLIDF